MRDWAGAIGRKWFFLVARVLGDLHGGLDPDRPATRLLRELRPPARLRPVEPDDRQVGQRSVRQPCGHPGDWRPRALGPVSAAAQEPDGAGGSTRARWRCRSSSRSCSSSRSGSTRCSTASDRCRTRRSKPGSSQLADRSGIDGGRVFEVAKSEDTKALNAYVTGFGATKRIVLWDTSSKALDRPPAPVRDGARDGPLRARARVEADHPAVGDHPRTALRRAPPRRAPSSRSTATASGSRRSATWRRCR